MLTIKQLHNNFKFEVFLKTSNADSKINQSDPNLFKSRGIFNNCQLKKKKRNSTIKTV